jgi:hexosaminidase
MKLLFTGLLTLIMTLGYSQEKKRDVNIMPLPANIDFSQGYFNVDKSFSIRVEGYSSDRLFKYADKILRRISNQSGVFVDQEYLTVDTNPKSSTVILDVAREGKLQNGEDESYELLVSKDQIIIKSETDLGAMHGLETLYQLLEVNNGNYSFQYVTIKDNPRFVWRGLMLDVARHFMSVDDIKRNLDLMASVKMNIFHWHLSDDQGFRVQIDSHPELYLKGSDGNYYTKEQIKDIVSYASDLGIRVIPEIDVPGHATAILTAMPQLASKDTTYTLERNAGIFLPVLDPTNPEVYKVLDDVIREMSELFTDKYFHIGGDENEGKNWESNPEIVAFMEKNKLDHPHDLQAYFNAKLYKILAKYDKEMMGWEEIQNEAIPKGALIQSWRGVNEGQKPGASLSNAVKNGYDAILSNGFYIDLLLPAGSHYSTEFIPKGIELTKEEEARILGGEATMWSELITPLNVDSRVWPRTAAIAEKFWSSKNKTQDVDDMYRRLDIISPKLERIGSKHLSSQEVIIRNIANYKNTEVVKVLVDVCEPMKIYSRNPGGTMYKTYSPYSKFADACVVDARGARAFDKLVKNFINDNSKYKEELKSTFRLWKTNHKKFVGIVANSPVLEEVALKSKYLSDLGKIGLKALEQNNISPLELKNTLKKIDNISVDESGRTNLVVTESMKLFLKSLNHR